ncbi:MAG: hypothetical protein RRY47_07100 [Oscillospiraceae bacterium]
MKIYKAGCANAAALDTDAELSAINAFAKTELLAEQIYTFSVGLCDNEVDRDFERFSDEALLELSELFVGRTGIFDHEWKAANQTARIYRTELVKSEGILNSLGQDYRVLKGYAYMLRSEKNAELISEIEAGIKKETSVGCSVNRRVCSICGEEIRPGGCGHVPGREYDGKLCFVELFDAKDAYEWSFVAVPAQRAAGVIKRFGEASSLKGFVQSEEGQRFASELEALEKDAALGQEYRGVLRTEVLRLGLLFDRKLFDALRDSTKLMGASELLGLKEVFEKRLEEKLPMRTQLPGRGETVSFDGESYRV